MNVKSNNAHCVSLSQDVPKILGTQRDAGTRLATALRRRPFSACNKGNRRRLHEGNSLAYSFFCHYFLCVVVIVLYHIVVV